MKRRPDSEAILEEIGGFLEEIYKSLEASVAVGLEDFRRRGRPFERYHFSSTVRNEMRNRLAELAKTGAFKFQLIYLNNNGLQAVYRTYGIRIRLAESGGLPTGKGALEDYYEQVTLPLVWPTEEETIEPTSENLMVLWDIDKGRQLAWVDLIRPSGEGYLWRRRIAHPATITAVPPLHPAGQETVPDLEFEEETELVEVDEKDRLIN